MSEACGITGENIMFSSNVTPAEEYVKARELGAIINLDDITHIDFLKECAGIPGKISCRYNPGGVFKVSNDIMDNPNDAKYGMTKTQMFAAFTRLKELGVKEFGIHSFLVSNTVTNDYYPMLAAELFKLAVELKEKCDVHIGFINLSGGVGVPYRPEQEPNDIFVIGEGVRKAFEEILVPNGMGDISIFTELGRFMLAPYGHLVTKAIHEKHIYKEFKYDVTGSLCENNDKFAIDRMLPHIDMGDYLVIHDTGAHGFSMGYNYNGRLRSAELLKTENGKVKLIRRAETPADYFATLDYPGLRK